MLACPNCEYENNGKGRPVIRGELATCLDCGSSWKEYSNGARPKVDPQPQFPLYRTDRMQDNGLTPSIGPDSVQSEPYGNTRRKGMIGVGAIVLVALGLAGYSGMQKVPNKIDSLAVADVRLETNKRQNGAQIVTVKGKIRNNTAGLKKVPPVTIVLRDHNGKEISRWRYNSLKVALNPGSAARFSSSIQHASSRIASADIILN